MKVGVLTFPNSVSYGATLQMYALCRVVDSLGHEVEAINYYNSYMKRGKHLLFAHSSRLKRIIKKTALRILHKPLFARFSTFEKKRIPLYPHKFFTSRSKLLTIGTRYDAVICGSDQVWNPGITNEDLSYFLDFCSESTRRISYAPSFGVETLSDEFRARVSAELEKFFFLSARESQGQALIADMIGKKTPVVLDPTMLLDASQWQQLEEEGFSVKGDYILYYTVRSSPRLFAKCRAFAQQQGLTMVVIGGKRSNQCRNKDSIVRYAIDISPTSWLWLMHHARYVVTNSFHGTAFSIIFEKDFYLELTSNTNSRLSNIVKMLGLEDRIIPIDQDISPSKTDYTMARQSLIELRNASLHYLSAALSEDDTHG